jgi:hypothetical protein
LFTNIFLVDLSVGCEFISSSLVTGLLFPYPAIAQIESFKTFHGKLFIDLQMLLVTPDSAKSWTHAGRSTNFSPFACAAAVDHPAANPDITGQLPAFSHLHAALRTPDGAWRYLATTSGLCVAAGLA